MPAPNIDTYLSTNLGSIRRPTNDASVALIRLILKFVLEIVLLSNIFIYILLHVVLSW